MCSRDQRWRQEFNFQDKKETYFGSKSDTFTVFVMMSFHGTFMSII